MNLNTLANIFYHYWFNLPFAYRCFYLTHEAVIKLSQLEANNEPRWQWTRYEQIFFSCDVRKLWGSTLHKNHKVFIFWYVVRFYEKDVITYFHLCNHFISRYSLIKHLISDFLKDRYIHIIFCIFLSSSMMSNIIFSTNRTI